MFGIVPKKKVSVADIKQYLVDEFKNSEDQRKTIENLKDKIKKALEIEIKYNTALVTLDEYKNRLTDREKRIKKLEKDIEELENQVRKENNLKNDEIIKYKKLNTMYDELKKKFDEKVKIEVNTIKGSMKKEHYLDKKNFIEKKINKINNLKGNVSKNKIIEILSDKGDI